MTYLLVRHKVEDLEKWKAVFDAHEEARARAGLRTRFLFRNIDNPREIVLVFEAGDLQKVRAYAASADLKSVLHEAGVADVPDFYFLE